MAAQLNIEEQESIDQIKSYWDRWGKFLISVLCVVMVSYAAWNGWQWWQHRSASQAAMLYDTIEQAAEQNDLVLLERSLQEMQNRFPRTTISQHAALLAAHSFHRKNSTDQAKNALLWVMKNANDQGLAALARLRLAELQLAAKEYAHAQSTLEQGSAPASFQPLFDERQGDLFALQLQTEKAKSAYLKAWQGSAEGSQQRDWLGIKLNQLGVDPKNEK